MLFRTEFFGGVHLLVSLLLGSQMGNQDQQAPISQTMVTITCNLFRIWNAMAVVSLGDVQEVLGGADRVKLAELFHLIVFLFDYLCARIFDKTGKETLFLDPCTLVKDWELLNEVIEFLGYFSCLHPDNQQMLQMCNFSADKPSELTPASTLLGKLCALPFEDYYLDAKKLHTLMPTLINCTFQNEAAIRILAASTSPLYLWKYIERMLEGGYAAEEVARFAVRFKAENWLQAKEQYGNFCDKMQAQYYELSCDTNRLE